MISPAKLGLTSRRAAEDLEALGLKDEASLWTLAGAADPDLALNNAHRFANGRSLLLDDAQRTPFFALMGGSTALADHLIAHPELVETLTLPLPSAQEADEFMAKAATDEKALKNAHRSLVMRVAAKDLAGTFSAVKGFGEGEPLGYRAVTEALTNIADAALKAALKLATQRVYGEEEPDATLAVIAMGKCGARELNSVSYTHLTLPTTF